MKKLLSIFTALAMMFCFSTNLFTFAANEPAKDSKQISKNESGSTAADALKVAVILAGSAAVSAVAGLYAYEKGHQEGIDNNWLSGKNIADFGNVLWPILKYTVITVLVYKFLKTDVSDVIGAGGEVIGAGVDAAGNVIEVGVDAAQSILTNAGTGVGCIGRGISEAIFALSKGFFGGIKRIGYAVGNSAGNIMIGFGNFIMAIAGAGNGDMTDYIN